MLPDMNLMTDLDLGGKIVQETGVSFNIIILEMVTIKGQSKKKILPVFDTICILAGLTHMPQLKNPLSRTN